MENTTFKIGEFFYKNHDFPLLAQIRHARIPASIIGSLVVPKAIKKRIEILDFGAVCKLVVNAAYLQIIWSYFLVHEIR